MTTAINNKTFSEVKGALSQNPRCVLVQNMCDSGKIFFLSTFKNINKLVVLSDERTALNFYDNLKFYENDVYFFNEHDLLFGEGSLDKGKVDKNRLTILNKLLSGEKITIVTTILALIEKLPEVKGLIDSIIEINKGEEFGFEKLIKLLISIGYDRTSEVEKEGEFSVHGGIIDIFDIDKENPIRIEFFDDNIESIRFYNIDTKRSIDTVDSVKILPYRVINKNDNEEETTTHSIIDYFNDEYIVFLDEVNKLENKIDLLMDMMSERIMNHMEEERTNKINNEIDSPWEEETLPDIFGKNEILNILTNKNCIELSSFDTTPYINDEKEKIKKSWDYIFDAYISTPYFIKGMNGEENTKEIYKSLKSYEDRGFRGIIVLTSHTFRKRFVEELNENNIKAFIDDNKYIKIDDGNILVCIGDLTTGFVYEDEKFFIFTEKDLFGIEQEKKRKITRFRKSDDYVAISDISSLKLGDYIVHETFGIGIFRGVVRLESDEVLKDYVKIEYADQGILYVLATKLEVLEKYAASGAKIPKLNNLNTRDFKNTRRRVKEEVYEMAKELINLYAIRANTKGYSFSPDTVWQREFEETFPYIETFDQLSAISKVKEDMESNRIMDRLICGDVGFGKTEVALRASFKAVQDGKQVVYLVPTTILCMQHYNTFKNRLKNYPINVDFLSRFKTRKENINTIEKLKNGDVDIVIGTHRLISEDVGFKNLGLLIIDEEQRFGVKHKEKIRRIKNSVDTLSLSATPIPRTLYMSLSGIRDMSLLTEAPPERMPIKTYVLKYNEELIREAVERELKRNGQVFIVHNNVKDIYKFANKIQELCPYARVGVSHGKLNEDELSKVMLDFYDKRLNVLVTTTIIETGLDIQNANTLIVCEAEKFGLSQLYQLRGRVGRSNRTAYAFFMYTSEKNLTGESEERLNTIRQFTALGSGIKIAMKDLEIRGAGNLLGVSQSGRIEQVGYDLYMKLLNEAVNYIKSDGDEANVENFVDDYDTVVDIDINAFIPDTYIDDEETRLYVYRKISDAKTDEEFYSLEDELKDRFGDIPKEIENLLFIAKLKIKAHKLYITRLIIKRDNFSIFFTEKNQLNVDSIFSIADKYNDNIRLVNGENPSLIYRASEDDVPNTLYMLNIANEIIDSLKVVNKE